jgi:hypothetical protein
MQHLKTFILSEGKKYQELLVGSQNIHPRKAPDSPENGLDGWSFMMCTREKDFALFYFENQAITPTISELNPNTTYYFQWFNPVNGEWKEKITVKTGKKGRLIFPEFPNREKMASTDWAAKLLERK